MPSAQLSCDSLSKAFGGVRALRNLSVKFPTSGVIAIVGPNGAGKSTLVDVITGVVAPDAGRVSFGGKNITRWPMHKIARLGIVRTFQQLRLIMDVSVLDNVLLSYRRQIGERFFAALLPPVWRPQELQLTVSAREILNTVGMGEVSSAQLARNLSYGQQKLLSLACCMALGGDAFFLDEPFAGVHPSIREVIQDLIRKIGEDGGLVVFVEHDLDAVRAVADQVVVMDQGTVLATGRPVEVLNQANVSEAYVH